MPPRVSVIVPFWNAEQTLGSCLAGLRRQDWPAEDVEILLVDNNSTDGSAGIVARESGVRLLSEPKQGAYAARNRALRESRGELVAFTDPDCVPEPDWLRQLVLAFERPEVMVVLGRPLPAGDSAALEAIADYERAKEAFVLQSEVAELYYGHTNNMAVRRSAFEALGPFEELLRGGDTVFVRRVVEHASCRAVQYCPDARVRHLEIDGPSAWLRKARIYGRSARSYGRSVSVRPLTHRERWGVVRRACSGRSVPRRLLLVGLVLLEGLAWRVGQLRSSAA